MDLRVAFYNTVLQLHWDSDSIFGFVAPSVSSYYPHVLLFANPTCAVEIRLQSYSHLCTHIPGIFVTYCLCRS